MAPQILADQLTRSQPGGAGYAPPNFQTFLWLCIMLLVQFGKFLEELSDRMLQNFEVYQNQINLVALLFQEDPKLDAENFRSSMGKPPKPVIIITPIESFATLLDAINFSI